MAEHPPLGDDARYRAAHTIGAGGIGVVKLVYDARLGRQVAYKTLQPGPNEAAGLARFLREARITAQLEHPGVVPVHDLGVGADGEQFYTMKYVRGQTLNAALRACGTIDERLALLGHFVDVCQAIAYAHHRGVVHRDLKPANVMVGEFGETQILDWGLAKVHGEAHARDAEIAQLGVDAGSNDSGATMMGTVLGTPAYMSPEQANGRIDAIDMRSDVYSLGAMLYEILAGRRPYDGDNAWEVVALVRRGGAPPITDQEPAAPPELIEIAEKAMSRSPEDRYQTAAELAADVEAWRTGGRVSVFRYTLRHEIVRTVRRHRLAFAVAGVAAAAITLGGVVSLASIIAEKNRAVAAEQAAQATLGTMYSTRATELLDQSRWPEAALYGATSLLWRETAEARGVLVATAGSAWPALVLHVPLACLDATLIDPDRVACATTAGLVAVGVPGGATTALSETSTSVVGVGPTSITTVGAEGLTEAFDLRGARLASGSFGSIGPTHICYGRDDLWLVAHGASVSIGHPGASPGCSVTVKGTTLGASWSDERQVWALGRNGNGLTLIDTACHLSTVPGTVSVGSDAVAWNRDSTELWRGDTNGGISALDPDTGAVRLRVDAHLGAVRSLVLLENGRFIASVSDDGTLAVHGTTDGRLRVRMGVSAATRLAGAGESRLLSWDPSAPGLRVWDFTDFARRRPLLESDAGLTTAAWAGDEIVTFHGDGTAARWSPDGTSSWRKPLFDDVIKFGAISPDTQRIAAASSATDLSILDYATGAERLRIPARGFMSVGWTNDGRSLIASDRWGVQGLPALVAYDAATGDRTPLHPTLSGAEPRDLAISPVGSRVAFVDGLGAAHVFDLGLRALVASHPADAREITFSADGEAVFYSNEDGTVVRWLWRTAETTDAFLGKQHPHTARIDGIAASRDGRYLATASWDRTVALWDARSGARLAVLRGHSHRVADVAFSADSTELVSAGWDGDARRWNLSGLATDAAQVLATLRRDMGLSLTDGSSIAATTPEIPFDQH